MPDDALLAVTLTPAQAEALRAAVATGEYPNVEAAIADALDAWSRREEVRADDEAWMKARILASIDDPRPSLSLREVDVHMQALFANARKRRDQAA